MDNTNGVQSSRFDAHAASVCRKVGGQVNALNRLQNILPCKVKELLYRAFVLPHFYYCSQVWHHCGSRNTKKIEKVNERALRMLCTETLDNMTAAKDVLRGIPSVNTTYGLNSFRYFAAKQWNSIPNELRLRAGGLEFNKQVRNIQF